MVKHEVMVRKSRQRALSENNENCGNVHNDDLKTESPILLQQSMGFASAAQLGYKSIGNVARLHAEQLETQQIVYTEDQLADIVIEPRVPINVVEMEVEQPLVVSEMKDGVIETVDVLRDTNIVDIVPSPAVTCNDAPVIDDYAQIDFPPTQIESSDRPKLPFSLNGRLVGTRYYGPAIMDRAKKPTNVVVFNDDPPASTSSCVLL